MKNFVSLCFAFGFALSSSMGWIAQSALRLHAAERRPPNVVLILADDLGWTDLGCFGSDLHETPNLDGLASRGIRFTQNYSACTVCSPTRAAILTGKYPARLHITDWIPGAMPDNPKLLVPEWTKQLPHTETTLAEVLRHNGYATATMGKWHLGTSEYYPESQGFDLNVAGTDRAAPPSFFAPWKIPTIAEGKKGEYLTYRLAQEAAKFIDSHREEPFFLYLPHFAVHTPIQGPPELVAKYEKKITAQSRHRNPRYAAMVEALDEAVGIVLKAIADAKLDEETIIFFTSDNGGRITDRTTTNEPLRFGKASAYEGGVRVPFIALAPGVTKAGTETSAATITMDLVPTIIELVDAKLPPSESTTKIGCDGVSLVDVLKDPTRSIERSLYWHYPHHQHYQLGGTMPYGAMRSGDYKLIEFYNDETIELYNISKDIGEKNDLARTMPDLATKLRAQLHGWRNDVGAQMPTPNPDYDPSKPEYNPAEK